MRVIKFGGTSVQDAQRIRTVLDIADTAARAPGGAVLVSSAMAGTTDALLRIADYGKKLQREKAAAETEAIRTHHLQEAEELLGSESEELPELLREIERIISQVRSLLEGILLLRECSSRTRDAIISCGELLSTSIIAAGARSRGIASEWIDIRACMRTDDFFGAAHVDFPTTNPLIQQHFQPKPGFLYITQGFIGAANNKVTTTLGRGGSDYSAAIIAGALGAEALEIWTDVDGIMTTDPRIVPSARRVPSMSYDEAAELAYFGAKVVHPSTMQPAVGMGIPIYVRNTHNPHNPGTIISNEKRALGLRAITAKKNVTVITVHSSRMLHAYGFMHQIFSVFAQNHTAIDLVATSEVSVSMSLDPGSIEGNLEVILTQLGDFGEVSTEVEMAIICLVGHDLWKDAAFIARVFSSLQNIPIRLISLGSSDTNLSLVVPDQYREKAVRSLHAQFFPEVPHV
ncbi:MAG: lysine-sensitive aspartokinase 3 [Spirochaeta sp.]